MCIAFVQRIVNTISSVHECASLYVHMLATDDDAGRAVYWVVFMLI